MSLLTLRKLGVAEANEWCVLITSRFGWVNASYVYGLQTITAHMRRALGTLTPYETFSRASGQLQEKDFAELMS